MEARYPDARRAFTPVFLQLPPPPLPPPRPEWIRTASPPSSPVFTSRPYSRSLRTRRRRKQPARISQALEPLIQLTTPLPVLAPRTEYHSNEYLPRSSSSRVRAREWVRPKSRRQKRGVCTGTTPASRRPPPTPVVQRQRRLRHRPCRT